MTSHTDSPERTPPAEPPGGGPEGASVDDYTVADYLLDRLADFGIGEIFGVPGDFNLELLDHVVAHDKLRWVGNCNELNAGYAADGYGRLRGIAALFTTFGVGELSAANAIAGSYAEHVPVVHVVGAPSLDAQGARRVVHHSLGDGDFEHFLRIARELTCAQANLVPATATREIDRVLAEVRDRRLPGYLLLATDVARFPAEPPSQPIARYVDGTSSRALSLFIEAAARLIADNQMTVLADVLVHRLEAVPELEELLSADNVPYTTLMWGKSLVDESSPSFLGIYAGGSSEEGVRTAVEDAPVLVTAGVQFTDVVSGSFTQRIDPAKTIDIGAHQSVVAGEVFAPLDMKVALRAVASILRNRPESPQPDVESRHIPEDAPVAANTAAPLVQEVLWDKVCAALSPGNIVAADQGTSFYGMARHRLPAGVTFIGQPLWASIGYTLPAALGAGLAHPGRRPVVLIGDGAAQLTIQELGQFSREGIPAVIVLVNNNGYTVERAIHGPTAPYNDIAEWRWIDLPAALGAQGHLAFRASTNGELDDALAAATEHRDRLVFIEAVLATMDVPPLLAAITADLAAANARQH